MVTVCLSERYPDAELDVYGEFDAGSRPAVLIWPGGAYYFLSEEEQRPIASFFLDHGYQAFVLRYSVGSRAAYPAPLIEGSLAVWEIRKNCKKYGVDPDKIALVGFSAGAHAALMLATHWHEDISREGTEIPYGGNRPNATVTGYTPTTFEDFYQQSDSTRSRASGGIGDGPSNLIGADGTVWDSLSALTVHQHVSEHTPPAFLWKTTADLPESSTRYLEACRDHGIACELHIFHDSKRCPALRFDRRYAVDFDEHYKPNTRQWGVLALNWLDDVLNDEERER